MPNSNFDTFMKELGTIISQIQNQTSRIYIPVSVDQSPVNPGTEIVVGLRDHEQVKTYSLEGWFTTNVT